MRADLLWCVAGLLAGKAVLLDEFQPAAAVLWTLAVSSGPGRHRLWAVGGLLAASAGWAGWDRLAAAAIASAGVLLRYRSKAEIGPAGAMGLGVWHGASLALCAWWSGAETSALLPAGVEGVLSGLLAAGCLPCAALLKKGIAGAGRRESWLALGAGSVLIAAGLQGWPVPFGALAEVWRRCALMAAAGVAGPAPAAALGLVLEAFARLGGQAPAGGAGALAASGLLAGLAGRGGGWRAAAGFGAGHLWASLHAESAADILLALVWTAAAAAAWAAVPSAWIRRWRRHLEPPSAEATLLRMRERRLREAAGERLEQVAGILGRLSETLDGGAAVRNGRRWGDALNGPFSEGGGGEGSRLQSGSSSLAGILAFIEDLAGHIRSLPGWDAGREALLLDALEEARVETVDVRVSAPAEGEEGLRRGAVWVRYRGPCRGDGGCALPVVRAAERAFGGSFTVWSRSCRGTDGVCRVELLPRRPYRLEIRQLSRAKGPGRECGDAGAVAELPGGRIALLLSDGMGSGRQAAVDSEAAVEMVRRLLEAECEPEFAVRAVNAALLLRDQGERFATLDLALIDLFTGHAELIKVGAAPTLLRRGREVELIRSTLPPLGILPGVEAAGARRLLRPGDVLVMLSDGLLEAAPGPQDGEAWLARNLRRADADSAEAVLEGILRGVQTSGALPDDLSVIVCRFTEGAADFPPGDLPVYRSGARAAGKARIL